MEHAATAVHYVDNGERTIMAVDGRAAARRGECLPRLRHEDIVSARIYETSTVWSTHAPAIR